MPNPHGTRWRGKLKTAAHTHPAVRALFDLANEQQTCMTEIARRAGVQVGTMGDWRRRRMPRVDTLDACLNTIGYQIVVRPIKE